MTIGCNSRLKKPVIANTRRRQIERSVRDRSRAARIRIARESRRQDSDSADRIQDSQLRSSTWGGRWHLFCSVKMRSVYGRQYVDMFLIIINRLRYGSR